MINLEKYKWLILSTVSISLLLVAIDMTVLYIALPTLTYALQASTSEKLWIVNVYPLVIASFLLGAGTLGDRIGHKRIFISGLLIFGAASILAAYSISPAVLIAARALLGVGAAAMMPATLAIIRLVFSDEKERSIAIGIWTAVASGGAAIGPLIAGILLEYYWWGAVFLVNVPIVLIACLLSICLIRNIPQENAKPWDFWACAQIMAALFGLAYAIKEFAKLAPSYVEAVLALVVSVICFWLFLRGQRNKAFPLIDMQIFRLPEFSSAVLAALSVSGCLMGFNLVLSQYLQLVSGFSPLQAGLYFFPLSLGAIIAGPLSGWFISKLQGDNFLVLSLTGYALAILLFMGSLFSSVYMQAFCLFLLGALVGASLTAASNTIMTAAPPEHAGMAASIEEISYELGGGLGIAVMGSLMSIVYSRTLIIPAEIENAELARDGIDSAMQIASHMPGAQALLTNAKLAFSNAMFSVMGAAVLVLLGIAVLIYFNFKRNYNT